MNFLQRFFDLRSSSDPARAIETIREGVSIRGFNLWLLFCAAALASIGLDTNSTAVIIGAMLISPLMSPILGLGLSFGIHDRSLLLRSLRNLAAAVVLSLTASVLYFLISPFGNPTAELQARTAPTLLDVLVALFGGVAGIVSVSRTGVSNAVPGVAIATALMPPLCTAGYGLATAQWAYFAGAFYLFVINAIFISLTTFLMAKYMGFPVQEEATRQRRRYVSVLFALLILAATLPSVYFLYSVYRKEVTRQQIETIVFAPIRKHGNEIFKWEYSQRDSITAINIYHSGKPLGDSLVDAINGQLAASGLGHYRVRPHRVNLTREEVNELSAEMSRQMYQQLQLDVLRVDAGDGRDTLAYPRIDREARIAFPFVDTLYNGWLTIRDSSGAPDTLAMVFYESARTPAPAQQARLYQYLKTRLGVDTLALTFRPRP
ncbi:MAG: DUF389 domain-containing protein [Chitinophagaceae bacterium]|nr:MAG: DUF389 domain-containing protein [Chitinophagaceae bacterium]